MTNLKNFFNTMLEAEQNRYLLKQIINELNSKLSNIRISPTPKKPVQPEEAHIENDLELLDIISGTLLGSILGSIIAATLGIFIGTKLWFILLICSGAIIGLITPIMCSIKSVSIQKEKANKHNEYCYKMKLENYEYNLHLNEVALKSYNTCREIYGMQIKELESKLSSTEDLLNQLYSANVCYKKYCNLTAIATIAEYLNSGRCDILEGSTGAYSLYEFEIAQHIITSDIKKIKPNQYLLYKVIQSANYNASCIANKIERSVETDLKNIKVNSEISRLISEINLKENEYKDHLLL